MIQDAPLDLGRFRLLATFLAGHAIEVSEAASGEAPYTDGRCIFVAARSGEEQRREVICQAGLLGGGSLDPSIVKGLRGRPRTARRYLALEGCRVLAELAGRIPAANAMRGPHERLTDGPAESLEIANSRKPVVEPPEWFGTIRPSRLLRGFPTATGATPTAKDLRLEFTVVDVPEDTEDDTGAGEASKILRFLQNPYSTSTSLTNKLSRMLGASRSPSDGTGGQEAPTAAIRQVDSVGPNARPMPVPLHLTGDLAPDPTSGVAGVLYPEWDVYGATYRPAFCRVIELPVGPTAEVSDGHVEDDPLLRRRLSRLGLGPKVIRRSPDGDELDVDALIDLAVDLRSGHSPRENVYLERRNLARNLGVLILLDASGSTTDADAQGCSVHEHQRRAAVTFAATLEDLGDRVAVYGFRSRGRDAVHMLALKPFGRRFNAGGRARLNRLNPSGYTRLGAAIRHAGEVLKTQAGTPNRLLLLLSDGVPYDYGYEGAYAESDARRALEELRRDGVACLSLSIGASTANEALQRVFGSASHANAPRLRELSPRIDKLFLGALKELAAPSVNLLP